jgi:hypothetical protein
MLVFKASKVFLRSELLVVGELQSSSATEMLRKKTGGNMKTKMFIPAVCLLLAAAVGYAQKHSDFSGAWQFDAEKSKNVGMMSQMKMTQTIEQSDSSLDTTTHTTYQGRDEDSKTHYDLTGKAATNESPMGGPGETISKWEGDKLVTMWTSESAVAGGPKVVRKETRSLSADGKTMIVESLRGSNTAVVMVFDKK